MEKLRTRTLAIPLGGRLAARDTGAAAGLGTAVLRRMDRRRGGRSGQGPQSGAADRAQPGLPGLRRAAGAAARQGGGRPAGGAGRRGTRRRPGLSARLRADPRTSLPFQSVVVASDNDPYCRLERARLFAEHWGSRLVVVPGAGHINADSGLGDWPQGLKLLGALRRRSSWRVSPPPERIRRYPCAPCRTRAETRHTAFADTRLLPGRSCPSWGPQKPRDARVRGGVDRPRYRGSRRITAADCAASRHSSRARPDAASADRPWVDHWRRRPSRRRRARSWRPTRWR